MVAREGGGLGGWWDSPGYGRQLLYRFSGGFLWPISLKLSEYLLKEISSNEDKVMKKFSVLRWMDTENKPQRCRKSGTRGQSSQQSDLGAHIFRAKTRIFREMPADGFGVCQHRPLLCFTLNTSGRRQQLPWVSTAHLGLEATSSSCSTKPGSHLLHEHRVGMQPHVSGPTRANSQLHQSSLQEKIQLHRAPAKTTCPLPAAPVTPGQAQPLPGSPSPTLGDALRRSLPTHERAVFSRSVLLLHKKKETNSTRQEFPGPSASPAGRKGANCCYSEAKTKRKIKPFPW